MKIDKVPKHLLIIGCGYIGLEFAQMFRRFGAEVTMIEAGSEFIGREDKDIAEEVLRVLTDEGIRIVINTKIKMIRQEKLKSLLKRAGKAKKSFSRARRF